MKKFKILLTASLLIGLTACSDNFLDVAPSSSGDAATAIQTVQDAEVMMNGIMRNMSSSGYYGRNFIMYGEARGGDLTVASRGRGLDGLFAFDHSPSNSSYSGFWSGIYGYILQANNLIASIDKLVAEGAEGNFDDIKGQALTARAMMYFDLVRMYGQPYTMDKNAWGVPNITEPLDAADQPLRDTVEDNYNQIISDLNAATPLLSKSKKNGYLNFYANEALKAKVYLTMGTAHYGKALTAAEEVIGSSSYGLYSNTEWVNSWQSQFNKESIFELAMYPSEGDLGSSSLSIYLRRKQHGSANAQGQFIVSDSYLNTLNEDPNDVRWGVLSHDETSASRMGSVYKYSGGVNLEGDGKSTVTAVNIKVIRLSEIYLIAAEAALPTDKPKAVQYLNEIRKRAPNVAPATVGTISLDMILDEKSKELLSEGHKFFDMMRLGRTINFDDSRAGVPATRPGSIDRTFHKTILPIPEVEINANPGIGAQQNPDY